MIFPLNQFDGFYQQDRGKLPAEIRLFNWSRKSVAMTYINLGIKSVVRISF